MQTHRSHGSPSTGTVASCSAYNRLIGLLEEGELE